MTTRGRAREKTCPTTTIPDIFKFDGPPKAHPMIQRDKFHLWLIQDRSDRLPFALLPMPSAREMAALLEAVEWDERQASVRFQVPVIILRSWLGGDSGPQDHQFEYTRFGAQAAWSALAYVTGLPPLGQDDEERAEDADIEPTRDAE